MAEGDLAYEARLKELVVDPILAEQKAQFEVLRTELRMCQETRCSQITALTVRVDRLEGRAESVEKNQRKAIVAYGGVAALAGIAWAAVAGHIGGALKWIGSKL